MLTNGTLFAFLLASTVAITRLVVWKWPRPSPTIGGFRTHHWMYGLGIYLIGLVSANLYAIAIGFGLFLDELTYILIRGKNHADNYSATSLLGTLSFTILACIFSDEIVSVLPL